MRYVSKLFLPDFNYCHFPKPDSFRCQKTSKVFICKNNASSHIEACKRGKVRLKQNQSHEKLLITLCSKVPVALEYAHGHILWHSFSEE